MLIEKQAPYTGPYYGPSDPRGPNKGPTAIALKRALIRMGIFDGELGELDPHYNARLEQAVRRFQRTLVDVQATGQYGRGTWHGIRAARVPQGRPNGGEHALDGVARKLIVDEAKPDPIDPPLVRIRAAISDFCERAEAKEELWAYTQQRPYTGLDVQPERRHRNDCSSYMILAYHWARTQTGLSVPDPSGYAYRGWGNTWDDLDGHERVSGRYNVGDLAHYDGHVTICRAPGDHRSAVWSSFGQESGPERRQPLHYRDDLLFVVRPPLLKDGADL